MAEIACLLVLFGLVGWNQADQLIPHGGKYTRHNRKPVHLKQLTVDSIQVYNL